MQRQVELGPSDSQVSTIPPSTDKEVLSVVIMHWMNFFVKQNPESFPTKSVSQQTATQAGPTTMRTTDFLMTQIQCGKGEWNPWPSSTNL